jgi:hypothetical protein
MKWSFTQDRNKIKKKQQSMQCLCLLSKVFFQHLIKNILCIETFFYKTLFFVEIPSKEKSSEIPFALKKVVKEIFS